MPDIMRIIWLKTLLSGLCSAAWLCPWHLSTTVPVHLQGWKDNVKDNVEMLILLIFPGRMEGDFLLFACLCGRLPSKPGHVQRPWWVPVQVNISKIQYFQTKKLPNLRTGWSGPKCKQCKPRKGCKYGSCSKVSKSQLFFYWLHKFLFQLHQLSSLVSVSAMKAGQVGETLILNLSKWNFLSLCC